MKRLDARTIDFFDRHVSKKIVEKYGIKEKEAVRLFIESETYEMLLDTEQEIYMMSPNIVFDMWECEKITGDPRNSQYIRGTENE